MHEFVEILEVILIVYLMFSTATNSYAINTLTRHFNNLAKILNHKED